MTEWYKNGQKWTEGNYKNGVKEGLETWWGDLGYWEKDLVKNEGNYKDGKKEGQWIEWSEWGD